MSMTNGIFENVKTIAVVGLSDDPTRPSNDVATYLKEQGFVIVPINPNLQSILGLKAYPDLLSVPKDIKIDVVDVFRRSEHVFPHVKEAVERGDVNTIWLQEGIENKEAENYAREKGLNVISNFCIMKTHKKLS